MIPSCIQKYNNGKEEATQLYYNGAGAVKRIDGYE